MKCPKCNEEMMAFCRRDSAGFLNDIYYKCLFCDSVSEEKTKADDEQNPQKQAQGMSKQRISNWQWKAASATILVSLILITIMQIPIPVRVFATESSIDLAEDILPYISLANFTTSKYSLNYTEGQTTLRIWADYASATSTETATNITTCTIVLGNVLANYQDSQKTINIECASLIMTVQIRYQELIANVDVTAYMPLWTLIANMMTGQLS